MRHFYLGSLHVIVGRGPRRPHPRAHAGFLYAWVRVGTFVVGIDWR